MVTKVININNETFVDACELAAKTLLSGELVGLPTETVYGLAANAFDDRAINKIFETKGRPQDNPLIVHISDYEMLNNIACNISDSAKKAIDAFWPGPFTAVLNKKPTISDVVSCSLKTVAVRMPSHKVALETIKRCGVPLAAPSANISGKPSTTTADHVLDDLDGKIPLILDDGGCEIGVESTVVSFTGEQPVLLRPGFVSLEQLKQILPDILVSSGVENSVSEQEQVESPGMKHKHYAPKAAAVILKGELLAVQKYLSLNKQLGDYIMCFEGEQNLFEIPSIAFGFEDDGASQAKQIFSVLRELDQRDAKRIFIRSPKQEGVSYAVFNRLLRASGFKVVEV